MEYEKFYFAILDLIKSWENYHGSDREKLNGLAFSILVMLDGMSSIYDGDIVTLAKEWKQEGVMFHEIFERKKIWRNDEQPRSI